MLIVGFGGFTWKEMKASDPITRDLIGGCYEGLSYASGWKDIGLGIGRGITAGGFAGAVKGGAIAAGEVCFSGTIDRIHDNIREAHNDNQRTDIYRCGPTQICSGSSERGTGICHADTSFVDSLGKGSDSGDNNQGGDCLIC